MIRVEPVRQGGTRGFDVGSGGAAREGFGVGYGDAGSAARFFWSSKAGAEDRWGSRHPTVKPIDLIAWLVKLVTPPGGTFLDPFAGSGTAAVAALKTGRNAILIEREAQYVADIKERIGFYEGKGKHSIAAKNRSGEQPNHGPLFNHRPYDPTADAIGSYNDAVRAIGERVRAGEPVPGFFLSKTAE
jgi:site-specific DNA-methyltransferase (adenine-specific)